MIDESVLSTKELLGLQQAEERLKRDCIERLKRVTKVFMDAFARSPLNLTLHCVNNCSICLKELGFPFFISV